MSAKSGQGHRHSPLPPTTSPLKENLRTITAQPSLSMEDAGLLFTNDPGLIKNINYFP
jgi:hypothetical protein